jgi:outer membrane protein OmpA-like peptidoglycan-associated protein
MRQKFVMGARMRFALKTAALIAALAVSAAPWAQIRYEPKIDQSAKKLWSVSDSKIQCELINDIPGYGTALFRTYSGKTRKTSLTIHPRLGITQNSTMRFIATRPEWQSGGPEHLLGRIKLYSGFDAWAGPTVAWKVLNALSQGQQIFMPYTNSTLASGQNIIPSMSPLGFKPQYEKYLDCQQRLLPVSYTDVQMLPVVFKFQKDELTGRSLERLKQQIDYLKEDKAVEAITIRAFAYDMTSKDDNIALARKRSDALKKFYTDAGFKEGMIEVKEFNSLTLPVYAEGDPADESPQARNGLVTLSRDSSKVNRDLETTVPDVGAGTGE